MWHERLCCAAVHPQHPTMRCDAMVSGRFVRVWLDGSTASRTCKPPGSWATCGQPALCSARVDSIIAIFSIRRLDKYIYCVVRWGQKQAFS